MGGEGRCEWVWPGGAGFLGNIPGREGDGVGNNARELAPTRRPLDTGRIASPYIAGTTCRRNRHRSKKVAPPNGGILSHLPCDSVRGSARPRRCARRGRGFALGTSARLYWLRGGAALKRPIDTRQCDSGLLRIARRVYRGAELGARADLAGRCGLPGSHTQTRGMRRW